MLRDDQYMITRDDNNLRDVKEPQDYDVVPGNPGLKSESPDP